MSIHYLRTCNLPCMLIYYEFMKKRQVGLSHFLWVTIKEFRERTRGKCLCAHTSGYIKELLWNHHALNREILSFIAVKLMDFSLSIQRYLAMSVASLWKRIKNPTLYKQVLLPSLFRTITQNLAVVFCAASIFKFIIRNQSLFAW